MDRAWPPPDKVQQLLWTWGLFVLFANHGEARCAIGQHIVATNDEQVVALHSLVLFDRHGCDTDIQIMQVCLIGQSDAPGR